MKTRRQFLAVSGTGIGVFALGSRLKNLWPQQAFSAEPAGKKQVDFHSPQMAEVGKSAANCVRAGEACIAFCAEEFANGNTDMANCNRKVHEMVALTRAMLTLAAMGSSEAVRLAPICAEACHDCATACREHKEHFAHMHACKECMEACEACEKACLKLTA